MVDGTSAPGSRGDRESELTHALAAVRSRLAAAAEAAGRNVGEIELLPITKFFPATDVVILSRLGCRAVGESRDQEASAKVGEVAKLLAASSRADVGLRLAHGGPHSAEQGPVGCPLGAHGPLGRQLTPVSARLIGACRRAWRRAAAPIRCGSTFRSASTATSPAAASTSRRRVRSTSCARRSRSQSSWIWSA